MHSLCFTYRHDGRNLVEEGGDLRAFKRDGVGERRHGRKARRKGSQLCGRQRKAVDAVLDRTQALLLGNKDHLFGSVVMLQRKVHLGLFQSQARIASQDTVDESGAVVVVLATGDRIDT